MFYLGFRSQLISSDNGNRKVKLVLPFGSWVFPNYFLRIFSSSTITTPVEFPPWRVPDSKDVRKTDNKLVNPVFPVETKCRVVPGGAATDHKPVGNSTNFDTIHQSAVSGSGMV